jgi:STE24 endopeptidase
MVLGVGLAALLLGAASCAIGLVIEPGNDRVAPVEANSHFDEIYPDVAAAYTGLKTSYWAAATLLHWGTLAVLAVMGAGATLAAAGRKFGRGRPFLDGFVTSVLILLFTTLAILPISWGSGFRTESAFGLSTQTAGAWMVDFLARRGFWILVYSSLMTAFLQILRYRPRHGWRLAAGGGVAVAILGTMFAPRIIDPLFHRFTPLEDEVLAADIEELGERAGLDIGRVRVMDASRRTRRLNAYVSGLGATQQVVLYDNLLEAVPTEEILLIVAHEIGHKAKRHLWQGLLLAIPGIVIGCWALSALAQWQARHDRSLEGPADPAGLPLLWLAVFLAVLAVNPIKSAASREMEAEADWVSLELTGDPETFIALERRLAEVNLALIEPPGWMIRWIYTHPPVLDRIGMAEHWRALNPGIGSATRQAGGGS